MDYCDNEWFALGISRDHSVIFETETPQKETEKELCLDVSSFPTKVRLVKAMVFAVVMYGCESWSIMKAEHKRIYSFELWCWGRLLRVPWTARRANQSILKDIKPEYSLEGLILQQKLQYFHLMQKANSLEKTLMLGKIESKRIRGCQRMRWLASITHSMVMNFSKLWEIVEDRGTWGAAVHGVARLSN